MTEAQQNWIQKFNYFLTDRMGNIDDDVFTQISIIERFLFSHGHLPHQPDQLERVEKAVEVYYLAAQEIGLFPKN